MLVMHVRVHIQLKPETLAGSRVEGRKKKFRQAKQAEEREAEEFR